MAAAIFSVWLTWCLCQTHRTNTVCFIVYSVKAAWDRLMFSLPLSLKASPLRFMNLSLRVRWRYSPASYQQDWIWLFNATTNCCFGCISNLCVFVCRFKRARPRTPCKTLTDLRNTSRPVSSQAAVHFSSVHKQTWILLSVYGAKTNKRWPSDEEVILSFLA